MKKKLLSCFLIVASMLVSWTISAAESSKVEESVKAIAAEFENVTGVDCMVIQKGDGLALVKAMFNSQFGKKFMKGVTSMVIIDYSEASEEISNALRKKTESFKGVLQELKLDDKEFEEGEYARVYATINDNTNEKEASISDFMILLEDKESKMFLYMGGEILIDALELGL